MVSMGLLRPVHPHACGEIACCRILPGCHDGTSPRLWGDSPRSASSVQPDRYIPTLVGRFRHVELYWCCCAVHPHACGEIRRFCSITLPGLWYIPTLVGRFAGGTGPRYHTSVHPHACGEIDVSSENFILLSGTSPRLWGDSNPATTTAPTQRYIPTLVGRFQRKHLRRSQNAVHPHACGEIGIIGRVNAPQLGTSPRLWGDCRDPKIAVKLMRYIPTLVGRFFTSSVAAISCAVHPHACGEINIETRYALSETGTSPRLWGD